MKRQKVKKVGKGKGRRYHREEGEPTMPKIRAPERFKKFETLAKRRGGPKRKRAGMYGEGSVRNVRSY